MAKAPRLKVFVTPVGFHDAYVAAPSRAAALRAWGSTHDLFARGVAAQVDDPALTAEPLARPGEVIRRLRGTREEQIAALPADRPRPAAKPSARPKAAPRPPRPTPPSPAAADAARAELDEAVEAGTREQARLQREREALDRRAEALERRTAEEQGRLRAALADAEAALAEATRRYERALAAWEAAR